MSTIATRTGKGSALTWAEADANFTNLNTDKIQVTTITGTAGKTPLVDADLIPIVDSVGTALNKVTWANVKASLGLPGQVTMIRTGTSTWKVVNDLGIDISTVGTTTSGLQEAINYATTYGLNLQVIGGGTSRSVDYGIINCTTGITFPALRDMLVSIQGAHIVFSAAVTGVGIDFDSCMQLNFSLTGEVTYQGTSAAIRLKATNAIPVDTSTVITGSKFYIGGVAVPGGTPTSLIEFNVSSGSIIGNSFDIGELVGSGSVGSPALASVGIKVTSPGASTAFQSNIVDVANIHQVTSAAVQDGINTTNQANISNNIWRIGQLGCKGTNAQGWNSFGRNNIVQIGKIFSDVGGNINYGVYLQSGANLNSILVGSIDSATVASVNDLGTSNSVSYNGIYQFPPVTRINPTLAGTWANAGAGQPNIAYWKDALGNICMEGIVTGGGADLITTLPVGYRPSSTYLFPVVANGLFGYVQITSAGAVTCTVHTSVVLNGVEFRT